jgi:hypothetical protein
MFPLGSTATAPWLGFESVVLATRNAGGGVAADPEKPADNVIRSDAAQMMFWNADLHVCVCSHRMCLWEGLRICGDLFDDLSRIPGRQGGTECRLEFRTQCFVGVPPYRNGIGIRDAVLGRHRRCQVAEVRRTFPMIPAGNVKLTTHPDLSRRHGGHGDCVGCQLSVADSR